MSVTGESAYENGQIAKHEKSQGFHTSKLTSPVVISISARMLNKWRKKVKDSSPLRGSALAAIPVIPVMPFIIGTDLLPGNVFETLVFIVLVLIGSFFFGAVLRLMLKIDV